MLSLVGPRAKRRFMSGCYGKANVYDAKEMPTGSYPARDDTKSNGLTVG
jgi:hypothetical protein